MKLSYSKKRGFVTNFIAFCHCKVHHVTSSGLRISFYLEHIQSTQPFLNPRTVLPERNDK